MELWSVHHMWFLLLLAPQGKDSSYSSPAPAWGPSHRRQSPASFSNMSPSHWLQFFTNCSSAGSSPRRTVPQEDTAPVWVPPTVTSPASCLFQHGLCTGSQPHLGHPPAPVWGFPWAAGGSLLSVNLQGCTGQLASPQAAGLHHRLQENLCSFFTIFGVCRIVSLTYADSSLQLVLCSSFLFPPS